ncbi:hypothetical protein EZ428_20320 [Pedobacter frigiditerrae]|uniref:MtN3 and saliva related transmembrane protein n=1 Tax=Pedobacter frigiditerrae TaxID=2530452 RepID=A0A4R0MMT9_9SPHI|nr:SemiSWEET transporter [Pedobacter frigiditerrae]TCC88069.1 hypothetical protein EZ428_20320 [Pedobacter frigiditerrae]
MDTKTIIGIAAGVLTAVSTLPQIVKIIKEKKAQAISPIMFFVLLAGNALWVWYGLFLKEWPIIITNAFSVLCDILMIVLNYKYAKK